jgi:glyoxylase-like metal-dependent hydrolase (beta-lactamase superfamily II)
MWQRCQGTGGAVRALQPLVDGVHVFRDSCNVYVLVRGSTAVLVDFGSGDVLDHLADVGVESVAAVLLTHHHRDQAHGLPRAVEAGIPIWVPSTERDLFERVDEHWQQRALYNYYDLRQDRFSLLEPVPVAGTVPDYRTREFGGIPVTTVPTPGHTLGSVSYLVEAGGRRLAFTGDLIHSAGKVWSLAATQWTYTLVEARRPPCSRCTSWPSAHPTSCCPPMATRSTTRPPRSPCWRSGCWPTRTRAATPRSTFGGGGTSRSRWSRRTCCATAPASARPTCCAPTPAGRSSWTSVTT